MKVFIASVLGNIVGASIVLLFRRIFIKYFSNKN